MSITPRLPRRLRRAQRPLPGRRRRVRGSRRARTKSRMPAASSVRCIRGSAWSLLEAGDVTRAELMTISPSTRAGGCAARTSCSSRRPGSALLHRLHGRRRTPTGRQRRAAISRAGEPQPVPESHRPRLRDRASVLAVCCTVLGVIAVERRRGGTGRASYLGEATGAAPRSARRSPKFQVSDLERARGALRVSTE